MVYDCDVCVCVMCDVCVCVLCVICQSLVALCFAWVFRWLKSVSSPPGVIASEYSQLHPQSMDCTLWP